MAAPASKGPVIPLPPRRVGGPKKKSSNKPWVWLAALAAGATLGALGYEWIPGVTVSFDYILTVLLG
jgi:hypothetical protein